MSKHAKNVIYLALVTASILMVPLVAMQFTDEVMWTLSDFVFAGILIFGTGLLYQLATGLTANTAYRAGMGLALATTFILLWINGAVGVIGDSDDPLIVAGELRDAIRDGRAQERCVDISLRAADWDGLPPGTATIEVVAERHDVVAQVEGGSSLLDRTVHASCQVPP